jgi:type IV secretion system protein VirB8
MSIYEKAETWEHDVFGELRSSRKRAWVFAGASWAVSAILALCLVVLIPLKESVPYVIQQDAETGAVQVLRAVETGVLTQNEALVQYHLAQYVQAREGYDYGSIRHEIDTVWVMSGREEGAAYLQVMQDKDHPENPIRKFGDRATVDVNIKSISFLNENTASIRFSTETREGGRSAKSHWVVIVGYRFVNAPASQEVRFRNPLGFEVTTYRRSSEVVRNDS